MPNSQDLNPIVIPTFNIMICKVSELLKAKNVITKKDAIPFKIPKSINLVMVDAETGLQPNADTKIIIHESFKSEDHFMVGLEKLSNRDTLGFYDYKKQKTILRFY